MKGRSCTILTTVFLLCSCLFACQAQGLTGQVTEEANDIPSAQTATPQPTQTTQLEPSATATIPTLSPPSQIGTPVPTPLFSLSDSVSHRGLYWEYREEDQGRWKQYGYLARWDTGEVIYDMAFTLDGNTLITAGEEIIFWDLATGTRAITIQPELPATSLDISPCGQTMAAGFMQESKIILYDIATGEEVMTLASQRPDALLLDLEFSPDCGFLATGWNNHIILWDLNIQQQVWQISNTSFILSMSFSPDGTLLSAVGSESIEWVSLGKPIPRGMSIYGFQNESEYMVETSTGKTLHAGYGGYGWLFTSFTPDGDKIITIEPFTTSLYRIHSSNPPEFELLEYHKLQFVFPSVTDRDHPAIYAVAMSSDGKLIVAGDGRGTGNLTFVEPMYPKYTEFRNYTNEETREPIISLAFSPDGRYLASCDQAGVILFNGFLKP